MKSRLHVRILSALLAFVVTSGLLGGIDHLAGLGEVSAQWASAVTAPRA